MVLITAAGWLAMLTLAGVGVVTGVMASAWKERAPAASLAAWTASAGSCCATACLAGALGAVFAWGAIILAAAAAVLVIAAVAKQVSSDEKATPLGVLWDAVTIVRPAFKGAWQRMRDGKRPQAQAPPGGPSDEVAARRERKVVPLEAAVPDPPMTALPPPPPPSNGRTPQMTTPPPPAGPGTGNGTGPGIGTGSVADIFAALQAEIMRGKSQGLPGNHRTVKMFAEVYDYLRQHADSFAQYMAEQAQYAPAVWEPLTQMAAYSRASSGAASQSDTALTTLASMTVGAVAVNPAVRAPRTGELNAAQ